MPGRFSFDLRALPVRLILGLWAGVLVTLLAVGLPALWLVESRLSLPPAERLSLETGVWVVLALGAVVAALLAALLGYFLARRITTPLQDLAAASESMGRGDLSTPVTNWDSVTEVTTLARTLERTRRRLHTAYDDLARSKEWSENLIASLVEGVLTLDAEGRITSFSPGAERILNWRATDVIGRAWSSVLESPSLLNSGPGTVTRQAATTREGRSIILLITSGAITRHPDGTTEQAFVLRDVTQEEEAQRLREYFLANVSHELKTPLSSLRASVELLATELPTLTDAEERELVNSLWLGTIRLEELVDNLLSSASIRSGHFQIKARPIELEPILEELALTTRPLLALEGQRLEIQLPPALPLVRADPRRLNQVLVNLISNASKHGPKQAPIAVCAERRGERVIVSVIDQGTPLPTEEHAALFQPFKHGDDVESGGVGLGLAIVQTIVERQGGEVGVKRAPNGGNAFWFSLKAAT